MPAVQSPCIPVLLPDRTWRPSFFTYVKMSQLLRTSKLTLALLGLLFRGLNRSDTCWRFRILHLSYKQLFGRWIWGGSWRRTVNFLEQLWSGTLRFLGAERTLFLSCNSGEGKHLRINFAALQSSRLWSHIRLNSCSSLNRVSHGVALMCTLSVVSWWCP